MAGSHAEERIRAKVETALKAEFPDARIVHELKIEGGAVRLDLAAVRPGALTIVEIKSERDVLKRLKAQVEAALMVTGDVRVYAADKHREALHYLASPYERDEDGRWKLIRTEKESGCWQARYITNPDYIRALGEVLVLTETENGFRPSDEMHSSWWPRRRLEHMADPRALLELLWAEELRTLCTQASLGVQSRSSRGVMKRLALEYLTGSQIRAGVCMALRSRPFARAGEVAA
jgi:hypothetical protein